MLPEQPEQVHYLVDERLVTHFIGKVAGRMTFTRPVLRARAGNVRMHTCAVSGGSISGAHFEMDRL